MSTAPDVRRHVETSFRDAPVVGVVRTGDRREALAQARSFEDGGLELIEITFTVPGAPDLVRQLLSERSGGGPPWIGMGSATTPERAEEALAAGAEFVVTPNVDPEVARRVKAAGAFLVMGALTPSEIVAAHRAGADLVKVFPLPPVGGPAYLATIRGPLWDVPMLASGGYGVEEIPAYRQAGAVGFGIGAPLLGATEQETRERIRRALALARGEREETTA